MEKKSTGKTVAIVILILMILGLGGYIAYDKLLTKETKEAEQTEATENKAEDNSLKEPKYDLSNVPQTSSQCTSEFTLSEYNKLIENLNNTDGNVDTIDKYVCDSELYKFIIKDIILDNVKQDVQLVSGYMSYLYENGNVDITNKNKTGIYVNGVKHESLNSQTLVYLDIHKNMLFTVTDAGTSVLGNVNVLAFDKNGTEKYNLNKVLEQEKITDPNFGSVNPNTIYRGTVKIDDTAIRFNVTGESAGSTCINGYRGATYIVKYNNGIFEKPAYEKGFRFGTDDNCTQEFN